MILIKCHEEHSLISEFKWEKIIDHDQDCRSRERLAHERETKHEDEVTILQKLGYQWDVTVSLVSLGFIVSN